jgi:hypothetical protein
MTNRTLNQREEIRGKLRIDEDDMDRCLVEHSEYFHKAAEQVTEATATRDALKLELEELVATLDRSIRERNIADDIKMSETGLSNTIKTTPRFQEAQRKHMDAVKVAADWGTLKEAFQQRSYMLRELNQRQIAQMYNLSTERGTAGSRRNAVGDRNRAELEQSSAARRNARRDSSATERYRPGEG